MEEKRKKDAEKQRGDCLVPVRSEVCLEPLLWVLGDPIWPSLKSPLNISWLQLVSATCGQEFLTNK